MLRPLARLLRRREQGKLATEPGLELGNRHQRLGQSKRALIDVRARQSRLLHPGHLPAEPLPLAPARPRLGFRVGEMAEAAVRAVDARVLHEDAWLIKIICSILDTCLRKLSLLPLQGRVLVFGWAKWQKLQSAP